MSTAVILSFLQQPVKDGEKPLSIAIDELNSGKIKIIAEDADK